MKKKIFKIGWSSAGTNAKYLSKTNHLPKLFSAKPWGFVLDPQQNRSWYCHTAFFPLKCSHGVHKLHAWIKSMQHHQESFPSAGYQNAVGSERLAQVRLPKASKGTNPRPGKHEPRGKVTELEWQDCCAWGWQGEGGTRTVLKHVCIFNISNITDFRHYI